MAREYFPRVKEAREVLREKAKDIIDRMIKNAENAAADGHYEVADSAYKWLLEHMPAEADGTKVIDVSVDKEQKSAGPAAPSINIGFALGGAPNLKALPAVAVVEIPKDDDAD